MKRAMIIGATSGIGEALAKELSSRGWRLGLCARRQEVLDRLADELGQGTCTRAMDLTRPQQTVEAFSALVEELGGVDLVVISSGVSHWGRDILWEHEDHTVQVNVVGFVRAALCAYDYFVAQGGGHLVGISSVAGHRGSGLAPAYSASKAFESNYLAGLRQRSNKKRQNITVTDVRPGYVATPMTEGQKGMFWVGAVDKVARQIADAVDKKRKVVFVTRRWGLVARLMSWAPDWIYDKLM